MKTFRLGDLDGLFYIEGAGTNGKGRFSLSGSVDRNGAVEMLQTYAFGGHIQHALRTWKANVTPVGMVGVAELPYGVEGVKGSFWL